MAAKYYDEDGNEITKEEHERILDLETQYEEALADQFDQDYENDFDDYDSFGDEEY